MRKGQIRLPSAHTPVRRTAPLPESIHPGDEYLIGDGSFPTRVRVVAIREGQPRLFQVVRLDTERTLIRWRRADELRVVSAAL